MRSQRSPQRDSLRLLVAAAGAALLWLAPASAAAFCCCCCSAACCEGMELSVAAARWWQDSPGPVHEPAMALLAEVALPLRQRTPELLVSSRTHLPGYQGLVEE